jgi:acyl-coenzyme A synthetase/AMP-(fatty) acid ligase
VAGRGLAIVGTVPPQHMYGLESTIMLALQAGFCLHASRPFYPEDIRRALAEVPAPRMLVTTPLHLRTVLEAGVHLPPLALILCATAPLPETLAAEAETRFGAPVREIYGCTETGQVATRRTVEGPEWRTLPGIRLRREGERCWAEGGAIAVPAPLTDVIKVLEPRRFRLQGRIADLVNIAGKRSSLAYLNAQLTAIPGVRDGVFFLPDEDGGQAVVRLAAFVVAPELTTRELLAALRSRVDPAFLPRPLHRVDALPRNSTGKVPREALVQLAAKLGKG